MDGERQFRATTDQMLLMIERLRGVEQQKQQAPLGGPEFIGHAHEAERLSRMIFRWSGMQLQMAEASSGAVQRGEMGGGPLAAVEPRPLDRILANWREAQFRFELATPGSPEAAAAMDDVERLREEFQSAQSVKLGRDGAQAEARELDPA
jgi:hypothetical protein